MTSDRLSRLGHNARLDEYDRSLNAYLGIETELDAVKERQKQERELFTEQQKDIKNDLREAGLSLKVFKELVTRALSARKARRRLESLEDHVRAELDVLQDRLSSLLGTPLGDVAYQAGVDDLAKKHGLGDSAQVLSLVRSGSQAEEAQPTA